jgi:sarcosine oxidase, subunit alpha
VPKARRLASHPLTRIERGRPLAFHHEGRRVEAHEGETVAAALYAAGHNVLSRSMRYHRPRGLYCGTGACTHCFLRIDGVPNQRACLTPCTDQTWSEGQNAFPNVRFDLLSVADLAYPRYFDAHSAFVRPAPARSIFHRIVRGMAGFGRVPKAPVPQSFRRETVDVEVLVVGAGPGGLAAADAAARAGARVTLVEAETHVGGRLRHLPTPFHASRHEHAPRVEGKEYAAQAAADLARHGVDMRSRTRVFGVYDGRWAAATDTALLELHPQRVILAPGAIDAYPLVPGADRAGVLLPTAAFNVHGIAPQDPVLVYGATREGLLLARDLLACGVRVAGVFEPAAKPPAPPALVDDLRRLGVAVQIGHRAAFVAGSSRPRAVIFDTPTGRIRVACATLVCAAGRVLLSELFQQAGAQLAHDEARGGVVPILGSTMETTVRGLFAAGSAAGVEDEWSSVLRGRIAGAAAAASLQPDDAERRHRLEAALDQYAPAPAPTVATVLH